MRQWISRLWTAWKKFSPKNRKKKTITIFSVKSTFLLKKLQKSWFDGKILSVIVFYSTFLHCVYWNIKYASNFTDFSTFCTNVFDIAFYLVSSTYILFPPSGHSLESFKSIFHLIYWNFQWFNLSFPLFFLLLAFTGLCLDLLFWIEVAVSGFEWFRILM